MMYTNVAPTCTSFLVFLIIACYLLFPVSWVCVYFKFITNCLKELYKHQ